MRLNESIKSNKPMTRGLPSILLMPQAALQPGVGDGRGPYAATGNIRSFDLVLPERLEYLSFGADPDPDNNGILNDTPLGLVTDNGDVIYYKLMGDGKRMVKLRESVHIREGELINGRWLPRSVDGLGQAVVLTDGSRSVTFELVYDGGTTYM
jgi:hypothetical protein